MRVSARAGLGLCAACVLSMIVATSVATPHQGSSPWSPRIAPLPSPAAADSGQPQLSVSNRGVLRSWIERSGAHATLKFAERSGQGWSTPRTVASGANWFVNWADVPSVLRLGSGTLAAHWLQKSARERIRTTCGSPFREMTGKRG